ncbi:hypothetical protein Q7P37_003283 [Cladosporium fusiforme]
MVPKATGEEPRSGCWCDSATMPAAEHRREHAFYRYYEAIRPLSKDGPTFCDVLNPEERKRHKPVSCPDKTLTAFCQLGALRMKARRGMIFCFDVDNAYVLAEATRSTSLEDDSIHDPGETKHAFCWTQRVASFETSVVQGTNVTYSQLWMGHATMPRGIACCEITVNRPPLPNTAVVDGDWWESVFVIDDLTKHAQMQDKPFVTDYPKGRSYVGMPITTPSGINIGAFCVLDDNPRDGVSKSELVFMRDMAKLVTTHLETIRAQYERQSAAQMMTGLGTFLQRGSSPKRKAKKRASRSDLAKPSSHESLAKPIRVVHNSHSKFPACLSDLTPVPAREPSDGVIFEYFDAVTVASQSTPDSTSSQQDQASVELLQGPNFVSDVPKGTMKRFPPIAHHYPMTPRASQNNGAPSDASRESATDPMCNMQANFQKAAEVVSKSLSVDGVAFLDASAPPFTGLSEAIASAESPGSKWADQKSPGSYSLPCQVLGCAQSDKSSALEVAPTVAKTLTSSFIRALLRHYPHGKIWNFDKRGFYQSRDSSEPDASTSLSSSTDTSSSHIRRRNQRKSMEISDCEQLQQMFPGVRSVALRGIWDSIQRRWSVGCLVWNYDPFHVFTGDTELTFLITICDLVAAENQHLEASNEDKAKADFISRISHELKSPLHGILGSTELLADGSLDSANALLVEQITSCGRNLLDTIEHLLDFADIQTLKLRRSSIRGSKAKRTLPRSSHRSPRSGDMASLSPSAALDKLTEEAVMSSVHAFLSNKSLDDEATTSVVLDIDRSAHLDWQCHLATGAWRRICMNLVNNALKFTQAGYVRVGLSQRLRAGSKRRYDAVLTVADSGQGMSQDFQRNHLLRDFTQENPLMDGIGLGIHIVGRMVHSMGGQLDVTSGQHGAGTNITVTVPLDRSRSESSQKHATRATANFLEGKFQGLKANVCLDNDPKTSTPNGGSVTTSKLACSSIEQDCRYLGIQTVSSDLSSSEGHDVKIVVNLDIATPSEESLPIENVSHQKSKIHTPQVVICQTQLFEQDLEKLSSVYAICSGAATKFLPLPYRVETLANAISSALEAQRKIDDTISEDVKEGNQEPFTATETPGGISQHDDPPKATQEALGNINRPSEPRSSAVVLASQVYPLLRGSSEFDSRMSLSPHDVKGTHSEHGTITGSAGSALSRTQSEPQPSLSSTQPTPVLLLVDDNSVNLKLLTTFSKKRNYTHLTAVNGSLAVHVYRTAHRDSGALALDGYHRPNMKPSIIFMDINMPVMDGYQATRAIRAYEKEHQLKPSRIIALTALASEAAHREALACGFDDFLSKPVKLKDLSRIIDDF